MPEMLFRLRWPDASETTHYSPSLVIEEHFALGQSYELADFLARSRVALRIASDRVEARYGMPCGRAIGQSHAIARLGAAFDGGQVTILAFDRPGREAAR